jgi:predicted lipid-binding transport protein (Tim44 family)
MSEIILFALVAGVLVFRLYSILGQKDDNFGKVVGDVDNVIPYPGSCTMKDITKSVKVEPVYNTKDSEIAKVLELVNDSDNEFTESYFIEAAKATFEVVIRAFADGNKQILKKLLKSNIYENFCKAIDERDSETRLDITLVSIKSTDLVSANVNKNLVTLTVKFVTEQITLLRNKVNEIIKGDASKVELVQDIWSFEHNLASNSPEWKLAATKNVG